MRAGKPGLSKPCVWPRVVNSYYYVQLSVESMSVTRAGTYFACLWPVGLGLQLPCVGCTRLALFPRFDPRGSFRGAGCLGAEKFPLACRALGLRIGRLDPGLVVQDLWFLLSALTALCIRGPSRGPGGAGCRRESGAPPTPPPSPPHTLTLGDGDFTVFAVSQFDPLTH